MKSPSPALRGRLSQGESDCIVTLPLAGVCHTSSLRENSFTVEVNLGQMVHSLHFWLPSPPALRGRRAGDEGACAAEMQGAIGIDARSIAPHPRPLVPKNSDDV